ncbi:hypothetical protein EYF80_022369 [Liparis tanakae]|uniref:Uncharacterized protein n=1 Tax=Liparis tanakae TaxID=230148 RepID=A0A4Z2HR09_9TELE|nr:hypothetical protein EYF80_022369 [Liparis tanakae]
MEEEAHVTLEAFIKCSERQRETSRRRGMSAVVLLAPGAGDLLLSMICGGNAETLHKKIQVRKRPSFFEAGETCVSVGVAGARALPAAAREAARVLGTVRFDARVTKAEQLHEVLEAVLSEEVEGSLGGAEVDEQEDEQADGQERDQRVPAGGQDVVPLGLVRTLMGQLQVALSLLMSAMKPRQQKLTYKVLHSDHTR